MAFITAKALDKTKLLNQPFSLPISGARVIAIFDKEFSWFYFNAHDRHE